MGNFEILNHVNDGLIKEMIELDKLVFKGDNIGDFNKCKEWVKSNPDIYTILLYNNKVIGYINFMPITDNAYNRVREGKLKDYELTGKDIVGFSKEIPLKCLFTSIVINPEYQTGIPLTKLWSGFLKKLKDLKVNISSVIMDCVTKLGEKCAIKYLNAKFVSYSNEGKVYEGVIEL